MPFAGTTITNNVLQALRSAQPENDAVFGGLRSALSDLRAPRQRFAAESDRFARSVESADERGIRELGGTTSASLAQQFSPTNPTFAGSLDAATRKSRVRSGIQARGEAAVRNQQLRDRIEIARRGRTRQGQSIGAMGTAANIRRGVNTGVREAESFADASRAGLLGGIAGIAGGVIKDRFGGQSNTTLQEIDLSTLPKRRGP